MHCLSCKHCKKLIEHAQMCTLVFACGPYVLFLRETHREPETLRGLMLKSFYCYSDSTKTNLSPPHIYLLLSVHIERFIQRCSHRYVSGSAAGRGLERKIGGAVVLHSATTHSSFRIFTLPHTVIQLALILSTHTYSTHTHIHGRWIRVSDIHDLSRWLKILSYKLKCA